MGPIDYMGAMPQQNFLQNVLGGLQAGSQIQQAQFQQEQRQLALDRAQAYNTDISTAMQNPTPQAFTALALKYPEHREAFKQGWETLNQDQQQSELRDGAAIAASLHSGRPDLAAQQIQARIEASKNSGQPTKPYEDLLQLVQKDPNQAYAHTLGVLAGIPGGDKILSGLTTIGTEKRAEDQAPADLAKKNADAGAAESDAVVKKAAANNAQTAIDLENKRKAQEIAKSQADAKVAEFNAQIAAANSETERGRLTLERDKFIQEQAKLTQTQGNAAQDGMDALTQGLQTIKSIKEHPGLTSNAAWLGGVGSTTGKIAGLIPGTDRKDLEGLVETLKSQQFLSGVKQLANMGSLSNAEGEKIGAAVASLNLDQSPQAFKNALGVIEKYMMQAQLKTVARGQLPTQGGAYVTTVPGIGVVDEGHINAVLKATPGATREQVIKYLQSVGGK